MSAVFTVLAGFTVGMVVGCWAGSTGCDWVHPATRSTLTTTAMKMSVIPFFISSTPMIMADFFHLTRHKRFVRFFYLKGRNEPRYPCVSVPLAPLTGNQGRYDYNYMLLKKMAPHSRRVHMDRKEAIPLCLCKMCPTFLNCNEDIAFCLAASGKSTCITIEKGCLCPGCPVHDRENFEHVYYCIRGSEIEQH
jgi:hypothetical protein